MRLAGGVQGKITRDAKKHAFWRATGGIRSIFQGHSPGGAMGTASKTNSDSFGGLFRHSYFLLVIQSLWLFSGNFRLNEMLSNKHLCNVIWLDKGLESLQI